MAGALCIRNLTSHTLTLTKAELIRCPSTKQGKRHQLAELDGVKPGLCGLRSSNTEDDDSCFDSTFAHVEESTGGVARALSIKDAIGLRLESFGVDHTLLNIEIGNAIHCLTFADTLNKAHVLELHNRPNHMAHCLPNVEPDLSITGLYLNHGLLAILRDRIMSNWMRHQSDQMPLELLSLPGSHNSSTYYRALPSVRCQAASPREQLENGVRFLDLRLQVDRPEASGDDNLTLVHGAFPVSLCGSKKFRPLYEDIVGFLIRNPSEAIIMSLKREGTGAGTDADLAQKLHEHYVNEKHWVTKSGVPLLGEARGRITLLRRFQLTQETKRLYPHVLGIDAQVWADKSINSKAGDVHIQDFYEISHPDSIHKKIKYIHDHCERANSSAISVMADHFRRKQHRSSLFLNFLSGSSWRKGYWPEKIAANINPEITRYLGETQGRHRRFGIGTLVCDWVGEGGNWDLIKVIVAMNESTAIT